jgi:cellulose synthase/poly-beta-1,6-N-acetylglucosamine synthase-like glycosyltransferase
MGMDGGGDFKRFAQAEAHAAHLAREVLTLRQAAFGVVLCLACVALALVAPHASSAAAHLAAIAVFALATGWRLLAAAASLMPPPPSPQRWMAPEPTYTILCPMRHEANVLPQLVGALDRLDYPKDRLDVKLVLEEDDAETIAAARSLGLPAAFEIVLVPPDGPKTKPKALNYALGSARGRFVAIYDAEDLPDPGQLRAALDAFAAGGPGLGVVQAPLLADNGDASWLARQFAAEYAIQFREMLPLLARLDLPLPLGGTSNHFRREALSDVGGWDPYNVTEDADIGYRLARAGWRMGVIAPPTWEEAPTTWRAWLRQRTRWIKGHVQTWLVLMRDPMRTWRELGTRGFLAMHLMLGGAILAALAHAPLQMLLLAAAFSPWLAAAPADWALAGFGLGVNVANNLAAAALLRDAALARAALTAPFYWPLATVAALCALIELVVRPHYWAKTAHGLSPRGRGPSCRATSISP